MEYCRVGEAVGNTRGRHAVAPQAVAEGESLRVESKFVSNQPPRRKRRPFPIERRVPKPGDPLSPREAETLDLLLEGLSNKLIADRLGVSAHTAKYFVHQGLAKLGASGSRVRAAVLWDRRKRAAAVPA
jgi:DNA-binding CsgD family transcriptional regulator